MKPGTPALLILIVLAGIGGYYIWQMEQPQTEPPSEAQLPLSLPEEPAEPVVQYPVPQPQAQNDIPPPEAEPEAEPEPLPPLLESDDAIQQEFARLFTDPGFAKLFIFKAFIHRFVVTVDNLTTAKLPQKYRVTTPPADSFLVQEGMQDTWILDTANYQRYSAYIGFIEAIDIKPLAAVYIRYYPLFQQAYEDLGYPERYFNDRLVEVIDHLLDTPEVGDPIELVRPNVFYKFADPELEALSAGQKILIRIGNGNAVKVKSRLKELRQEITNLGE